MTVELTGIMGRPKCTRTQRSILFTAGLGIRRIDGLLEWFPLEAWGETAIALFQHKRGHPITVTGQWKTKRWKQNGVQRSCEVFVVSQLEEAT